MPSGSQYVQALQTPALAILDEELAAGEIERTALGLPRPISGNTASVFVVTTGDGRRWALRCFVRLFPDQLERYEAISAALAEVDADWKVEFEFQPEGIFVAGEVQPVVKMAWVEGDPLATFVADHLWEADVLAALAVSFAGIVEDLRARGIAHGDLQHGNLVVTPDGRLRLIDYDGMFVPALGGQASNELGHRNYRHPQRTLEEFGPRLDAFPGWVIFLSLAALSLDPLLWGRLDGGDERLLFREEDFTDPAASAAFTVFARSEVEQVRYYGAVLAQLLEVPPDQLPALSLSAAPQLAPPRLESMSGDADRALFRALAASADVEVGDLPPAARGLRDRVRRLAGSAPAAGVEADGLRRAVDEAEAEIRRLELRRAEIDRIEEAKRSEVAAALEAVQAHEHAELRSIGDSLVKLRASVQEEVRQIEIAMGEERIARLTALGVTAKREHLFRQRLANVAGLGDSIVFALARLGVRAASDFVEVTADAKSAKQGGAVIVLADGRQVRVTSLGPSQADAMMRWRRVAEAAADAAAPTHLDEEEEAALKRAYAEKIEAAQSREPAGRSEAAHASLLIQQRSQAEQARLQHELQQAQHEAAAERVNVDKAISSAKKDVAEARFRLGQP